MSDFMFKFMGVVYFVMAIIIIVFPFKLARGVMYYNEKLEEKLNKEIIPEYSNLLPGETTFLCVVGYIFNNSLAMYLIYAVLLLLFNVDSEDINLKDCIYFVIILTIYNILYKIYCNYIFKKIIKTLDVLEDDIDKIEDFYTDSDKIFMSNIRIDNLLSLLNAVDNVTFEGYEDFEQRKVDDAFAYIAQNFGQKLHRSITHNKQGLTEYINSIPNILSEMRDDCDSLKQNKVSSQIVKDILNKYKK